MCGKMCIFLQRSRLPASDKVIFVAYWCSSGTFQNIKKTCVNYFKIGVLNLGINTRNASLKTGYRVPVFDSRLLLRDAPKTDLSVMYF